MVGEETNKLVGYLAADLAQAGQAAGGDGPVISAAGKSTLMDAVLPFMPAEDKCNTPR